MVETILTVYAVGAGLVVLFGCVDAFASACADEDMGLSMPEYFVLALVWPCVLPFAVLVLIYRGITRLAKRAWRI